ncbi:MAG: outer membrane beta-barrel protein [Steroidobacteraceae bacterium]
MTVKSAKVLGWCLVAGGSLFLTAHSAQAQEGPPPGNPLGVYVGAGLGMSTIRQDAEVSTGGMGLERSSVGGDVFLGIRPLPYLGAEIGYVDFGNAHRYEYTPETGPMNYDSRLHESADAPVAFAVGYIPLQPWWDLYVKAGGARLHKSWDFFTPTACDLNVCEPFPGSVGGTSSNWDFAYGVGSQINYGPVAWRLEYVRVNATSNQSSGDPDLLSVGVSWTFF